MLAAEFHYTKEYCDRHLDLSEIISHLDYHKKNPPAGAYLKAVFESLTGSKENEDDNPQNVSSYKGSSVFTPELKEKIKDMGMKEKFDYLSTLPLTEEQKASASRSLVGFMDDWGAMGGQMK